MIESRNLSKRYGDTMAVDDLTFTVAAGQVTGFLGPNGSGKSTTMRVMVGLDAPTSGDVTIDGQRYRDMRFPLHQVGALLDAKAVDPGRSARNHLRWLAQSNSIPTRRVEEVLAMVGLSDVAGRRVRAFSLGMGQRLGIAAALLGDPPVLLFDEPVNGLDPEGILWVRRLFRSLAAEGRTILVSSHLMSEMALTADHLIVIGRGRLLATGSVPDFIERTAGHHVRVVSPDAPALADLVRQKGGVVSDEGGDVLGVTGLELRDIGIVAAAAGLVLYELSTQRASLEEAFMDITQEHEQFRGTAIPGPLPSGAASPSPGVAE